MVARFLWLCGSGNITLQQIGTCFRNLPKCRTPPVGRHDRAVPGPKIFGRDVKSACRCGDKDAAGLGACGADGAPALLDRLTTECVLFIRSARRVGRNDPDRLKADIELFCRNLSESGEDPLTEFGFPGEDDHGLVRVQPDPAFQPAVTTQTERQISGRLPKCRRGRQRKSREHNTKRLRKLPAGKPRTAHRVGSVAARRTARTIRLWVPQRQSWSARASLISSSLGFGFRSSKAFAAMIIPFEQ